MGSLVVDVGRGRGVLGSASHLLSLLMTRWYTGAKLAKRAWLWRRHRRGPPPVLVLQMGKVASQAVVRSLEGAHVPACQVHFVSERRLAEAEAAYRGTWDRRQAGKALHVWQGQWVRRRLRRRPDLRWRIITLVRDPVARNVSSFFQVAEHRHGQDLSLVESRADDPVAEVRRLFLEVYQDHDLPLGWLDEELTDTFGVDPYATVFPRADGFVLHRGRRADVLLIRYEDLERVFSRAVEALLGLPGVSLARANVSREKDYGAVYATVDQQLTLPRDYLDRMYGSRYAQHFYGQQERVRMRARWE